MTADADKWAALRRPFPPDQIELLPKQLRRDDRDKGKCYKGSPFCADEKPCGGYHARSIHLDYVGHAGITDRLLDVDPAWTLEPAALSPEGLPIWSDGGMWMKLTVLGVTRWCFGDAQNKTGANATKEVIGDALRNGAMRFGVGTYLWSKSDAADAKRARGTEADPAGVEDEPPPPPPNPVDERARAARQIAEWSRKALQPEHLDALDERAAQAGALDVKVGPAGTLRDVLRLARERVSAAASAREGGSSHEGGWA